jgi:PHP family Zn ribbon phosphoesterase
MSFVADLHIHSRYSRATSRNLDLEHLWIWAQRKGVGLVSTGDFTHPGWFAAIDEQLEPAGDGLFALRPELAQPLTEEVPAACRAPVRFMLTVEISNIYRAEDKTRKVHNLVCVPDLEAAAALVRRLDRIGNLGSDGRPILGLDSRDLLELVLESSERAVLIPAHIWTPWFSVLGSKSGFDAVDDCYRDLSEHIFALETGLSSD